MTPTREQIIQWAREAGFPFNKFGLLQGDAEGEFDADDMFVRLAALIAQAVRTDENEACAQVCDDFDVCDPKHIAAAIRARITNQPEAQND